MNTPPKNNLLRVVLPVVLAVLAVVLWSFTLPSGPVPGRSTSLVYQHLGLSPSEPLSHAVWGWLAKLLSAGGAHPQVLLWFSLLCGAACIALLYMVMTRMPVSFAPAPLVERKHTVSTARAIGASFAALYLAVSLPFWIVSTRTSTSTFDILLLLLAIYCLLRFRLSRRLSWAWSGCLVFAVGMTGFGSMFAIAPLYGLILIIYLVQNGLLRFRNVLLMAVAFVVGLSPWLIRATQFMQTPSYAWREFEGLWDVLYYMLREEYHGFKFAALRTGWIIIFLVSVLPWFIVVVFRLGHNRKLAYASRAGGFILNVVLTSIGILIALGITFVSPWRYGNPQDPIVTPYVLIAMWFGGLAAFWYSELIQHDPELRRPVWQKPLGWIVLAVMASSLVVAAVRNQPIADARPAQLARTFVDQTIENLGGREWFITSGGLDDNLAIAIRERGLRIRTLSLPHGGSSAYLKYVATLFAEPRLRGLAQVGLVPLFSEWVTGDPSAVGKIAIQNMPDLWFVAGSEPLPSGLLYVARGEKAATPEELFANHEKTWSALKASRTSVHPENPIHPINRWILGHTARVANNLGVYLEDAERPDLARKAYEEAIGFDTNNISAKLNLYNICVQLKDPATNALNAELTIALKNTNLRRVMWSLAYHYGFVRRPDAYAERGWAWVLSGKPNLGLSELNRARQMVGDSTGYNLAMGNLYLQQDQPAESEQSYRSVLQQNPTNITALVGMTRVSILRQQYEVARSYIARLREARAPASIVLMEEATLETTTGNNPAAIKILNTLVKDYPEHWTAWTTLALLSFETGDTRTATECQTRLAQARNLPSPIRIALAGLSLRQNDRPAARRHLEAAIAIAPRNVMALEAIIRLDVQERRREEAERHVQMLLSVNARNALANYVLGTLQMFNGQNALAEASFRAALATTRSPETLNELAWCLTRQARYSDALPVAKESVTLQPRSGAAWDTYGFIQMKLGDLAAADEALKKAAALLPSHTGVMYHIALLYEARGMNQEALQLVQQIITRAAELDRETQDEVNQLMKRLRTKEQS